MGNGYVIPVDPAHFATHHSSESSYFTEDSETIENTLEPLFSSLNYDQEIVPLLERIPAREADAIILYYIQKKRQADIAEIFGVTQAAISYRLNRGLHRIRFLLSIPQVSEHEIHAVLPTIFKDIDISILLGMWKTTCQSEVASRLGLTQGRVRHRFFRAVSTLEVAAQNDPKYEPFFRVFSSISSKNFNVLRSVSLPQWSTRGGNNCI